MYSRTLIYIAVVPFLMCIACGQNSNADKTEIKESDTIAGSTSSVNDRLLLSPDELKDDSVFNDGSIPVSWENAGVTDPLRFKKFIRQLQIWVSENQVDSISTHISYPVRNPGIKDSKEFKLNYSEYFSDGVKAALADQKLNQIFRTQEGIMIGQGQIWLIEKNNNILITAINN